ncbi:MAG: DUF1659 domain-containing protein [Clostridium sp.]
MAVTKNLINRSLVLETRSGQDAGGNPVYRKKSFQNVKTDATPDNILDVADGIRAVLGVETRAASIAETHLLIRGE